MATFLSRIRALRYWIDRRRLEAELTEEIEDHRARRQAALERAGLSPAEATAASRRALGNVTLAHEDARAEWGWPSVERLWRDVRAIGRGYTPEDGARGRAIVLSDAAWRRFFDADPHVVGAAVTLDDQPFEIVGVMDADARLEYMNDPDLFTVIELKHV